MIFFGIDPGKSGSISAIWDDGVPCTSFCKLSETEYDIVNWLRQFDLNDSRAVIERVSASPQMGVVSAFTFGRSYGTVRGIICGLSVPLIEVAPAKWQGWFGCRTKGDKNISKAAAQQRWPTLKITHANADSLLLAEWGRLVAWSNKNQEDRC